MRSLCECEGLSACRVLSPANPPGLLGSALYRPVHRFELNERVAVRPATRKRAASFALRLITAGWKNRPHQAAESNDTIRTFVPAAAAIICRVRTKGNHPIEKKPAKFVEIHRERVCNRDAAIEISISTCLSGRFRFNWKVTGHERWGRGGGWRLFV